MTGTEVGLTKTSGALRAGMRDLTSNWKAIEIVALVWLILG
jgi:hypothetical protein